MRISGWSSDVCSSDLPGPVFLRSVTIDELGVSGRRHVSDVGGVHPHLPPHGTVGRGHALLGTATQHTEDCLLLAIEIAAFCLELGRSEVRRVGKACVITCRSRWSPYT